MSLDVKTRDEESDFTESREGALPQRRGMVFSTLVFRRRFTRSISPPLTRPRGFLPPSSPIKPDIHHAQTGRVAGPSGILPRSQLFPAPCPSPRHRRYSRRRRCRTTRRAHKRGAGGHTHTRITTRLQPSQQHPPTTGCRDREQPSFDELRLPWVWRRRKATRAIFI